MATASRSMARIDSTCFRLRNPAAEDDGALDLRTRQMFSQVAASERSAATSDLNARAADSCADPGFRIKVGGSEGAGRFISSSSASRISF